MIPTNARGFAYVSAYAVLLASLLVFSQAYASPAEIPALTAEQIIQATNAAREAAGLPALQTNPKLMRAAYERTVDMAQKKYFSHTAPNGRQPWYWLTKNGYSFSRAGENLAINFHDAQTLTQAWLSSLEHKKNLLNPLYQDVGVYAQSFTTKGRSYTVIVELYGTPQIVAAR